GHRLLDFFGRETQIGESLRHDFGLQDMLDCLNVSRAIHDTRHGCAVQLRGNHRGHQVPWHTAKQHEGYDQIYRQGFTKERGQQFHDLHLLVKVSLTLCVPNVNRAWKTYEGVKRREKVVPIDLR